MYKCWFFSFLIVWTIHIWLRLCCQRQATLKSVSLFWSETPVPFCRWKETENHLFCLGGLCDSAGRDEVKGQLRGESESTDKVQKKKKRTCDFQMVGEKRKVNEIKEAWKSVQLFESTKPVLMETGWLPDGFCQREKGEQREGNA